MPHRCASLLALASLGCLCRQTQWAVLQRWARRHWALLREPWGFDRPQPPHATTLSRLLAAFDADAFHSAFVGWLPAALAALPLEAAGLSGPVARR